MTKNHLFGAFALLLVLVACNKKAADKAQTTVPSGADKNVVTPPGTKKFIDPANMNLTVKPSEDFYEYANGAWLKSTSIPASESSWGSFGELREFNANALKAICEEVAQNPGKKGSLSQKVGDFYAAGMDTAAIEKAGMSPIKGHLDRIDAVKNYNQLLAEITTLYAEGHSFIWRQGVGQDDKNSAAVVPRFGQGGLQLPDRDYYLNADERSKKVRTAYEAHIANVFKLVGASEAEARVAVINVMKMELAFAKASMSRVEMRDPQKRYNKMTVKDLEAICPQFSWADYMKKAGIEHDYVIVGQPGFLKEVNAQLKDGTLEEWKTFLKWNLIKTFAPYLSQAFVNEDFNMSRMLSGQKEMQPRWKRVSQLTDALLGEALGQIYVDKHFKPEAKERMVSLVDNLAKVYERRIKALDWMSEETKTNALRKLNAFVRKIGYPDKWRDYSSVAIDRNKSYVENIMAIRSYLYKDNVGRIGKPVDRSRWGMTPPTVNAYYSPSLNEIVFPAGILQFPFFDNNADDAVNYGGIGAVIGHEMTHGFDDQGRQYDADGNLKDWWTPEDAKKFDAKAQIVVNQFNDFTVLDTVHVNGKLTLGENLADLGGVALAYEAFKTYSPQGKSTVKIDGFTPDQRFFLSWAQIWRTKMRDETLMRLILTDPHAPGRFRCNGPLSNFEPFYEAFGVKEGDKMWRPTSVRAKIW